LENFETVLIRRINFIFTKYGIFHTVVIRGTTNGGNTVKEDCECSNVRFSLMIGRFALKSKKGVPTV
jgi:hypothetical protein